MIYNVIDHRTRKYRWLKINAVIEDTAHDNGCDDADQLDEIQENAGIIDSRQDIPLHEAIRWAEDTAGKVTLYLYDQGTEIG